MKWAPFRSGRGEPSRSNSDDRCSRFQISIRWRIAHREPWRGLRKLLHSCGCFRFRHGEIEARTLGPPENDLRRFENRIICQHCVVPVGPDEALNREKHDDLSTNVEAPLTPHMKRRPRNRKASKNRVRFRPRAIERCLRWQRTWSNVFAWALARIRDIKLLGFAIISSPGRSTHGSDRETVSSPLRYLDRY